MSTLKYKKSVLIEKLQSQKAKAEQNYETDRGKVLQRAIKAIEKEIAEFQRDLALLKKGESGHSYEARISKKFDSYQYDAAIARLELCVDDEIALTDKSLDSILRLVA